MKEIWTTKRLDDVCRAEKEKHLGEPLPYVGMENIESGTGRFLGNLHPVEVKSSTFRFDSRHLLYGRLRPYLNKVLLPKFTGHCSSEVFPLRVNEDELDRRFLFYWITRSEIVSKIDKTSTGARMPRANVNQILDFEIELPPLEEQKRIVTILDEAFAGIDAAIANTEKNLANARELFESYLNSTIRDPDTEWPKLKLSELCEFANGRAHEKAIDSAGDYIVVNSKFISSSGKSFKKTNVVLAPLLKGDVAMVMSDVPKGKALAKCFIVDENDRYSLNQRICRIRSNVLNNYFLFYQLNRHPFLLGFDNKENQTNLRKGDILSCPLWCPGMEEQESIVARIDEFTEKFVQLELNYKMKLNSLNELKKSLLQKAFSGELTADVAETETGEAVA